MAWYEWLLMVAVAVVWQRVMFLKRKGPRRFSRKDDSQKR